MLKRFSVREKGDKERETRIVSYYPKCKIPFPAIAQAKKGSKRRYLQDLLPFNRKSNAEKIQKYLERCLQHPILSRSSLTHDFTRVQREEDVDLVSQSTCATLVTANNKANYIDSATSFIVEKKQSQPPMTPEDFKLIKVLGKGCIGKVLLVRSKRDNQLYALKAIQKQWVIQQKEMTHIRAERDILVGLRKQPFLVQLYHVFQTPSTLFFLLEYHAGGDLATQLSLFPKLTPKKTHFYTAEIIQGLEVLHNHGIVYRDLKPENVLIGKDGHIVLTDFGLSKIFKPDDADEQGIYLTQTFCGTAEYLAPEILLGEPYTFAVDFWSLGTLLFEMLSGMTPFWAEKHIEMYQRVIKEPLTFPPSFDKNTRSLLSGVERLGWGDNGIELIKMHPYYENIDWELLQRRQLEPPFIPTIKDEIDVSHFDTAFTKLPVRISQSSAVQQDIFDPFNFDLSTTELQIANERILQKRQSTPFTFLADSHMNKKRQLSPRGVPGSSSSMLISEILGSSTLKKTLHGKTVTKLQRTPSVTSTLNNSVYSAQTVENHLPSVAEPYHFSP
ncbi:kinase-like domain-containing protein [Sporodiniella umbellata]|nr:kinase-like domain-containing protein [Sporodiniella umbellata]